MLKLAHENQHKHNWEVQSINLILVISSVHDADVFQ